MRDAIRSRTLHAKVDAGAFDRLPENVRNATWFIVRDGTAPASQDRFTVRVRPRGSKQQIAAARLIVGARAGEYVRNKSGNRLDLRLSNLRVIRGAMGTTKQDALDIARPGHTSINRRNTAT